MIIYEEMTISNDLVQCPTQTNQ